jgi:hypothetical protein
MIQIWIKPTINKIVMKDNQFISSLLLIALTLFGSVASGQYKIDTANSKKNTIRVNITNPMIFGDQYNVIGYERIIGKNQSFSVNFGRFSMPKFVDDKVDSVQLQRGYTDKGLNFAVDYRFYLFALNRFSAPRGIYVGPYYAYNFLERTNTWALNTADYTGDVVSKVRFNANLVGAQLGYQFVIRNRLSVDIILMGPGVWFYNVKNTLDTELDPEQEAELFQKINEMLAQKLPGHEIVLSPSDEFKKGTLKTSSVGYRYIVHLGFRF